MKSIEKQFNMKIYGTYTQLKKVFKIQYNKKVCRYGLLKKIKKDFFDIQNKITEERKKKKSKSAYDREERALRSTIVQEICILLCCVIFERITNFTGF